MGRHPCSVNPELWFGYADDDGGDGASQARALMNSRPPRRGCSACGDAHWRSSGCARDMRSRTARNPGSGPASNCPAASTASCVNSWLRLTWPLCARSRPARSTHGSCLDNAALLARREGHRHEVPG